MRIVFCGGGTGGHITPMLAMADILRQSDKNAEFFFIGRCGGTENEAIRRAGYEPHEIDVRGLKRSLCPSNLSAVYKALRARGEARHLLRELAPDAVIGTGGYVSWPVLSAARSLHIRCAIHESNAVAGLVTRTCGRGVDLVMLGYSEAAVGLSRCNIVVTGNPVRGAIGRISRERARAALGIPRERTVILSFGGSLGAGRINEVMCGVIDGLSREKGKDSLYFIHATGHREYEKYRSIGNSSARILPYIEDMPTYLAAADIAVTRCGAMTIAELSAAGVPAILIPSPNVTANHQYENGKAMASVGGAVLLTEDRLDKVTLSEMICALSTDKDRLLKMRRAIKCPRAEVEGKIRAAVGGLLEEK